MGMVYVSASYAAQYSYVAHIEKADCRVHPNLWADAVHTNQLIVLSCHLIDIDHFNGVQRIS